MLKVWFVELWKQQAFWTLLGVVLGFTLGEVSRVLRERRHIKRLKAALRQELRSILAQIPQKVDIVNQMRASAAQQRLLTGLSVSILDGIYKKHGAELYPHLSSLERNCLHVIYERLAIADKVLAAFETDVRAAIAAGDIQEPFRAYQDRLGELLESYAVVEGLIQSYLASKPTDVFYVSDGGDEDRGCGDRHPNSTLSRSGGSRGSPPGR